MEKIIIDFTKNIGAVKPMHAVNNGPIHKPKDQVRSNLKHFAEAGIPYVRNHDASLYSAYGGEHTVDIAAVFPDFDADPFSEESYDFAVSDAYHQTIEMTGAKLFYRLGSKIEHGVKKYNTLPPKDFKKWAVICEHVIRHYTQGWADGFKMDVEYWEIWNEPDFARDDSVNKPTWGGTEAEFFEFYEIAAKHLKEKFPQLKIGGPALAYHLDWARRFLEKMESTGTPIDFFSWHKYGVDPKGVVSMAITVREMLDKYGYREAESILNEWNYVKDWGAGFVDSIKNIIGMKGAAYTAACMCACQNAPVDMLMYYDARPCAFNGLFDFYTLGPIKGYYPFKMFNELYKTGVQAPVKCDCDDLYIAAAADTGQGGSALLAYYTDDENARIIELEVEPAGADKAELYLLDKEKDCELVKTLGDITRPLKFEIAPNTVVMIRQIKD